MISDVLAMITFIADHASQLAVKKALFNSDAERIDGDEVIIVDKLSDATDSRHWFYHVRPLEGSVFIYMPMIPSVAVDFGRSSDSSHASADYFRFVDNPVRAITVGGMQNVKVNFMVFGYRQDSFLHLRTRGRP